MNVAKIGALIMAGSLILSLSAGAEDRATTHALVSVVNSSTDNETSAKVSLSCSSSTGKMTIKVSGINILDSNGNSFLAYFTSHGILPNLGWQLGGEAGNILITQNSTTHLWFGSLLMNLAHKADCSKHTSFVLNDQPFATGALKITGLLS